MGDEATTPFLSRIGGEIFQNYGLFSCSAKIGKITHAVQTQTHAAAALKLTIDIHG